MGGLCGVCADAGDKCGGGGVLGLHEEADDAAGLSAGGQEHAGGAGGYVAGGQVGTTKEFA